MPELQSESAPAIQAFFQWKVKPSIRRTGCTGSDNMVGSAYISQADLQDYLTTERIKTLLQELFHNTSQSPPSAERVRNYNLRPFAILLAVGYGRMICHFDEHRELQDKSLPFPAEPGNFPKISTHNLFQAFRKEQWQFCAVPLEYDMRDDLADDYILPITAKEEISGGGSAILYKITIDETYNKLKPASDAHKAARSRNHNTFALKTYRTPDAKKYFENERSAFGKLRYGERPPDNIIEYYGSFVRRGTYNIILEYADRGTLEDYMKNTPEPKTVIDIRSFWGNFLASMGGLVHIHGTPTIHEPASDEPNTFLGWHHDIDPSNILVVSKGHDSPYDCDFKIADLGLAHFKRYIYPRTNATDSDRYGMSAYGAPETFRSAALEKRHLLVPQSADIWSMGCVYSEVATWVTEGSAKLLEYRCRRQKEIAKKLGVARLEEDRFHHGWKILETVDEIHDEIKRNSRRCDLITPYVIERLVKGMVQPDPQNRGAAQFLLETSSEILEDAKRKREEAVPSGSAPNPDRTISDSGINAREKSTGNFKDTDLCTKRAYGVSTCKCTKAKSNKPTSHNVFLIDNGESMGPHRKKLEKVVELLATLTQPYDPDGLDLYFSTASDKLRPNTPEKFLKYVRERPAHGRPDFRQRFAKIIEDYQSRFGKNNHWARLRHPNSTPSKGPRPLSLYVLTNGVWDPKCTLIIEVERLVASLQEYKYPNKYVGIQFIRFGNDRDGKKRLKTLDDRLGLPLDVIDTTSAAGNVWKMLLGAVNDWYDYDGDPDDDNDDD
ncbi:MAG: hypothetical protein Q9204_002555 [Flavoplaca sp. TL-2023a]